nr:retrovirus-related Pol polyprotein from transposon TNT 1-94 [Tanacetum cinerariifolium]
MEESIPLDEQCQSSLEIFKVKIINAGLDQFHRCLNEEMVADLRYFNSLKLEVDSLRSQLETQKTQFLNEIDWLSREYYYADHMNAILGVYTELDETKDFCKERERYFKIQDLKAQLQDKGIVIRVIPTTSVSRRQLKSNPQGDRVMHNNSQGKKQALDDQRRSVNLSKNKTSVTTCNDSLNAKTLNVKSLVEIFLFIVDSGCSKHMTENLKLLINFMEKFLGTIKFRNDQIALILGYGDLVQRAVTIKRVYYVEGLNHNLFFVGQLCDADLEVAFRKSTCYIRDLKGNDLLTGSRGTDLYSITLQDTNCPNPICLMAKATSSQAWLWHRHLFHLNFDTINLFSKNDIVVGLPKLKFVKDHLCSSCELGKAKRKSFHAKLTPSSKRRLQLLHIDLCGPMLVQRGLQAQVRVVRTDKGTKFLNQTLHAYFAAEGILHQTSVAQTPEQNGIVERRNHQISSDPAPECQTMALEHDSLSLVIQRQENVPQSDRTVTTSNEMNLLFSLMFDELLNGSSKVVSKSFAVSAADAPNQRQQYTTPLNNHTTHAPTCQVPTLAPIVTSTENINQAETYAKNDQVADDEFINIFSTPYKTKGRRRADITRITKKEPKTGQKRTRERKEYTRAGNLSSKVNLDADLSGTPVDQTKYCSKVEALMYLTASGPDIMHATCYCARYQAQPTKKHPTTVKWIFQYLKDTIHMGLWYPKDIDFELTAFSDSDHAGCLDSRKSTSGGIQFLGGDKLVSWSSKKQDCTLMSFAEADHSHLVQSCLAFAYQAHRRSISLHQRKALPIERFKYLVRRLGMRCLTPAELEALANESA